jgi:hypothetical protein
MSVSTRYVLQQGAAIRGMGSAAFGALKQRFGMSAPAPSSLPGPEITQTFAPRDPDLVRDYIRHVGGDPASYRGRVPAHFFPQWAFAFAGRLLDGLNYPMTRGMNAGCRLIQNAPLPIGEALEVRASLQSVDADERRALIEQRMVTSTKSAPDAVIAHLFIVVPLSRGKGEKKDKPRVDSDAKEIAFWKLHANAGLDFAKLTGDFNPVHWVPQYARAMGFKNTILHGFGTMSRAIEGLNRGMFSGDADAIKEIEVRFTRPLVLPAKVGLYVKSDRLSVGDAPGGPAYLQGSFRT